MTNFNIFLPERRPLKDTEPFKYNLQLKTTALLYVVEVGFEVEGGAARALFQVVDRILPFLHSSPIGNRYIALACLVSQIIYNLRGRVGCFGQHRFSGVT